MNPGEGRRDSEHNGQASSGNKEKTHLAKVEAEFQLPRPFLYSFLFHSFICSKIFAKYLSSHCVLGYKDEQKSSLPLL